MARIDDKIAATRFSIPVDLTFDELLALADEAAEKASSVVDRFERERVDAPRSVGYCVRRSGLTKIATCLIVYREDPTGSGPAHVLFLTGAYKVAQPKMFGIIPGGPKDSTARLPFERFSRALQAALDQCSAR